MTSLYSKAFVKSVLGLLAICSRAIVSNLKKGSIHTSFVLQTVYGISKLPHNDSTLHLTKMFLNVQPGQKIVRYRAQHTCTQNRIGYFKMIKNGRLKYFLATGEQRMKVNYNFLK